MSQKFPLFDDHPKHYDGREPRVLILRVLDGDTVDGGEGGSGAAPQLLADHVGLPLTESLPMAVDTLLAAGLKDRIRVVASGKLVTCRPPSATWAPWKPVSM